MVEKRPPTPPEASEFHLEKIVNGDFKGKSILSLKQLDSASLLKLSNVTLKISQIDSGPLWSSLPSALLRDDVVGILCKNLSFNLPRISFEKAVTRLGGAVILASADDTSIPPRESAEEAIMGLQINCDLVVLTDPQEKLFKMAKTSPRPIISALLSYDPKFSKLAIDPKHTNMALLTLALGKEI